MCCQSTKSDCSDSKSKSKNKKFPKEEILNVTSGEKNNKVLKNEGKMRIYFYGENLLNLIVDQTFFQKIEKKEKNTIYFQGSDNSLNWEYFIFNEINQESNEIISNFIENDFLNSDFFDIIIITVKHLLDEDSLLFFKHFEKYTNQKVKQPFILYITKEDDNPKIEQLFDKITNEYFDKRTLFALKYPSMTNERENKQILELICKFKNYYHEEGDSFESFSDEVSSNYKFNILVCGRAGTGKSTFINEFLGHRKAKEGEGLSVTHKIVTYSHQKYPINISDTPGFEDEDTLQKVKSLLDLYNKKLIDGRKKINLILYLFPYSERSVLSLEIPLLENLIGYNTEIIFVMNYVTESIQKTHYKRIHQISIDSLRKIFPADFEIKLTPINLISQIDDDDPDNIKIIKSFGLDTLFKEIYMNFEKCTTNIEKIKMMKTSDELFWLFGHNKLFNHFKEINDLFISFRSELINIILSYGRQNKLSFKKEKYMQELADILYMNCLGKKCNKYEQYLSQLAFEDEVEKLFNDFTKDIKILKTYDQEIHTMYFYKIIHDHKTLALGYLCMKDIQTIFEKSPNIFMENDKLNSDLLINLCKSYNLAINGFKSIAENFSKFYEEEYKKNKEIVKKSKIKKINEKDEIFEGIEVNNHKNKNEIKELNEIQDNSEIKENKKNKEIVKKSKMKKISEKEEIFEGFEVNNNKDKIEIKELNEIQDKSEIKKINEIEDKNEIKVKNEIKKKNKIKNIKDKDEKVQNLIEDNQMDID